MSATRAQGSVNGKNSCQTIFGDEPTSPFVNRNIHETDKMNHKTQKITDKIVFFTRLMKYSHSFNANNSQTKKI